MINYNKIADYIIKTRHDQYNTGKKVSYKIHTPVISTGSLTIGGAGKTPLTLYIARLLTQQNIHFSILSRGYRRHSKGLHVISIKNDSASEALKYGDEPVMIKQILPDIPVIVCEDRYTGAKFIEDTFKPQIILLDDGFQHRKLRRDLDILIFKKDFKGIKAGYYPFGDLRDSLKRLKEANFIFLEKGVSPEVKSFLQEKSHIIPFNISYSLTEKIRDNKKDITAFCGIAKPERFLETLTGLGFSPRIFIQFS
ncbi:MAG TPA: tetraacyldisaccharide 4'-kinase, partial [Candidatus Marinimicrobia bacterium]|nr:tetraacyldisaccharide 4'-kinase [Candidatus Neomarinimicrobiota bacterium]